MTDVQAIVAAGGEPVYGAMPETGSHRRAPWGTSSVVRAHTLTNAASPGTASGGYRARRAGRHWSSARARGI
jgi:hypothetical protein